jgi:carboxyl-terminal processing protease
VGFPDVCTTPAAPSPVPVPYPNLALNAQATPFSQTVMVSMMNALNQSSQIPVTSGDEAGTLSPNKGPGRYTLGNPNVYVDMMPAINLTCPTTGNNMINGLGAVLVPSAVNVFYNDRRSAAGELGVDDMLAIDERLAEGRAVEREGPSASGVGCIRNSRVRLETPSLVHDAIEQLVSLGMTALVFDLRGCPGGDLDAAVRLAGEVLDDGALIATLVEGDGDEEPLRVRGAALYRGPLAVLVDRHTASAAEVVAGALQAHGRAKVIGERTYGKGSAERIVAGFDAPGARYVCAGMVRLPGDAPLAGRGVEPDVRSSPEDAFEVAASALVA